MLIDVFAQRAIAFLRNCFPTLQEDALQEVSGRFAWVHVSGGDTLLREGELGTCVYLLVSGRLRAYVTRADGSESVAGEFGARDVIGDVALLTGEPHGATIRATRDTELLRIGRDDFEAFLATQPGVMKQMMCSSLATLQRSIRNPALEPCIATIAVIPSGSGAPISDVAASLTNALRAFGPAVHLGRADFERGVGLAARAGYNSRGAAWLNEQERAVQYVVYEADNTATPWTRCCLRQADIVLAVGVAGDDPRLSDIEAEVYGGEGRQGVSSRLVLLQSDQAVAPVGTRAWLANRPVCAHHHVRFNCDADYARLARILTGRAVGLVLGGGGARGLAHIGALRALEDLGIPVDLIGGTSSGAVVAAALVTGHSWQDMVQIARERLVGRDSLLDFTVPFVSLVSGRRIFTLLHGMFEEARIEDLWLPYFCVSTNLSRARMVVHREGLLWRAVRASVSLPGILPPLLHECDLLVDGGVMNKLPVDVMRGLCNGGKVFAVSVSACEDGPVGGDSFEEHLSGWSILRRRLNPFRRHRRGPNIADILLCSTLVTSANTQLSLERQADVCVRVPAPSAGLFDFRSLDLMVEAGYRAAQEQLGGSVSLRRSTRSEMTHLPAALQAMA
jgi:NTE family protein/lysophospholipid hydrolase